VLPHRPLDVVVVVEDQSLSDAIVGTLESEDSIRAVRAVSQRHWRETHGATPAGAELEVRAHGDVSQSSLALVLTSDVSKETHELGEEVGAVGYLRKDAGLAEIAPVVVALAAACSGVRPL
jgi:hypothetical protein